MIRLRISLKWFLLATTATAILLGTVGKRLYDDWQRRESLARQQRVASKLEASGAGVLKRDGVVVETHIIPQAGAAAMPLLKEATSLERIRANYPLDDGIIESLKQHSKLRQLSMGTSPNVSDRALRIIGGFSELENLGIHGASRITDDGLAELANLHKLRSLTLAGVPIQGRGLIHIARLPNLLYLGLRGSAVDDDGLAALSGSSSLAYLDLNNTAITGAGLAHLRGLPKLLRLNLAETRLTTGEGLAELDQVRELKLSQAQISSGILTHLAEMRNLRSVSLLRSDVTDDLLADLKNAMQIEILLLQQTGITDAGLVHLENLKELKLLDLDQTHVTVAGARRLSDSLPHTSIHFPGGHLGPESEGNEPGGH